MSRPDQLTHLDLFSGIGGFALAAKWAGFRTVGFCEIEPYACAVLEKNFGAKVVLADTSGEQTRGQHASRLFNSALLGSQRPELHRDIRTLNGADFYGVTLLTGGFPCQPFSCAGKRRGRADDRHLWPEMLRVIAEARPAWVLGENVAGIINMELDTVLSDLEGIGYACRPFVIPACGVDARHRRNRVWIVGHAERSERRENDVARRCREQGQHSKRQEASGPRESGKDVSDDARERLEGQRETRRQGANGHGGEELSVCNGRNCGVWLPEPNVGRVAHGIPARVDRLRGLGNAIVPQVAFQILKAIAEIGSRAAYNAA